MCDLQGDALVALKNEGEREKICRGESVIVADDDVATDERRCRLVCIATVVGCDGVEGKC